MFKILGEDKVMVDRLRAEVRGWLWGLARALWVRALALASPCWRG